MRERDRVARLERFDGSPSAVYFRAFLTPAEVKRCLADVERHAWLVKRYQELRAAHVVAATGIANVRSWDLSAPLPGFEAPRYGLAEAQAVALEAVAPLGADYVKQLGALLDPANGRADIGTAAPNRYRGGYSVEVPRVDSVLYLGDFRGTLGDVRALVHEGGHAVHGQLMKDEITSPFYARGPSWTGEAFAILDELLLYDHLRRTSTDRRAQAFYLAALIDDITGQVFTSAEEGTLEQAIYDGVAAGRVKNASDLDALTRATLDRYEIWTAREPERKRKHLWMTKQLMSEDPLYLANYLYAGLVATRMYRLLQEDPPGFRVRYKKLLGRGFSAPPAVLLRGLFGREWTWEQFVADDMALLESKIGELAALYGEMDGRSIAPR